MPESEKTTALQAQIQTARDDFEALNKDLTTITELASTNEQNYENLKSANAPMPHRLEARTAMLAARDLVLGQKKAVNEAQATLQGLENQLQCETAWLATIDALEPLARETATAWDVWQKTLNGLPSTVQQILQSFVEARGVYIDRQAALEEALQARGQTLESVANDLKAKGLNPRVLNQPMPYHTTPMNPRAGWELTTRFDDTSGALFEQIMQAIRFDVEARERAARPKLKPPPESVDLDLLEFGCEIAGQLVAIGDIVFNSGNTLPLVVLCRVRRADSLHIGYLRVAELRNFTPEQQKNHAARAEACKTFTGETQVIRARTISELHKADTVIRSSRPDYAVTSSTL
jgi:hypothetical protein